MKVFSWHWWTDHLPGGLTRKRKRGDAVIEAATPQMWAQARYIFGEIDIYQFESELQRIDHDPSH